MEYISYKMVMDMLNITKGDTVLVSSSIKQLVRDGRDNGEVFDANDFIEYLMDVVGEEGTLLFPTYNWDFCKGDKYDYNNSPSQTGILSQVALDREDFKRTKHPIYSFAVWGKDQDLFCNLENKSAFGKDSPFAYLHKKGKNLIIDVGLVHSFTFVHYVEECIGVSYRYLKEFKSIYVDEKGNEETRSYTMYVRNLEDNVTNLVDPLGDKMFEENKIIKKKINNVNYTVVDFSIFYDEAVEDILTNKSRCLAYYDSQEEDISGEMYNFVKKLFPINRSLTGDGVRETLQEIKKLLPTLKIQEVASGSNVFDWTIPKEWKIREAYIADMTGNKIIDFKNNNLHVVGYSTPLDLIVKQTELDNYLFTIPDQPDWIPYVTSYYSERAGFAISENQRKQLTDNEYHLFIDSELFDGYLTYGELLIPGESDQEIFLSTYVCHPSMANNELSGPAVVTFLAKWLLEKKRRYSYRIIFIPETIGSLTYLSENIEVMKDKIIAGFNVTCVGDDNAFSYIPSRYGNTLADKIAKNIFITNNIDFKEYSFLERGSDERQYCAPGVDLPVCSVCRSKYGEYVEYHTSADNLDLISPAGLFKSYNYYVECLNALENNAYYLTTCIGEPQLGKRGLYSNVSKKGSSASSREIINFLAYADGKNDLIDISNIIKVPVKRLIPLVEILMNNKILEKKGA
ncbi:DUF4910 domain-containing protein [Erysipelotrichaceae bacterium OttesenSCG-928-M19]|nr:DUF4910 domain-containing protein [Erysipelotrichaceae bacterium OttesenSCG-928-M19]